jgi:hypothetical protein
MMAAIIKRQYVMYIRNVRSYVRYSRYKIIISNDILYFLKHHYNYCTFISINCMYNLFACILKTIQQDMTLKKPKLISSYKNSNKLLF